MIGHRFNSGAVCVALAPGSVPDEYIVLSHRDDSDYEPWVVGHIRTDDIVEHTLSGSACGEWFWGTYCHNLEDAVTVFALKVGASTSQTLILRRQVEETLRIITTASSSTCAACTFAISVT